MPKPKSLSTAEILMQLNSGGTVEEVSDKLKEVFMIHPWMQI